MISVMLILLSVFLILDWGLSVSILSILLIFTVINLNKQYIYCEDMIIWDSNMSSMMLMLTFMLMVFAFISTSWEKSNSYNTTLLMMVMMLMLSFFINNMLFFYIFFEASLIPILILIMGWGYQPERLQSGVYMIMYTVFASLPLLLLLLYLLSEFGSLNYYILMMMNLKVYSWAYLVLMLAFMVKLPLYLFHLWLPKAHVEAPLAGSMILAGILLKLGGYGIFLMINSFDMIILNSSVKILIISLSVWGGLLASLMCLRQDDIKSMVAYSSVTHMSIVFVGLMSLSAWGLSSSLITMVAHGFTSSALFLLAYISYTKTGSRSFSYTKGVLVVYPILSLMWFIFNMLNMAAPPTINLVGELMIIPSIKLISMNHLLIMMVIMFMSVSYNMFMYAMINHGMYSKYSLPNFKLNVNQYISLVIHLCPLFFLFKMNMMCF
nr:NADH dehydrogenase subunit 4 [Haplotrema minimum]